VSSGRPRKSSISASSVPGAGVRASGSDHVDGALYGASGCGWRWTGAAGVSRC
jgi:hypothetical protein